MVVLGDFEYREHEVGLGQLEGNEFLITLRDVGLHDSQQMGIEERRFKIGKALKQGMMGLAERGFLNYFGPSALRHLRNALRHRRVETAKWRFRRCLRRYS